LIGDGEKTQDGAAVLLGFDAVTLLWVLRGRTVDFKQSNIGDILDSERLMVLTAPNVMARTTRMP